MMPKKQQSGIGGNTESRGAGISPRQPDHQAPTKSSYLKKVVRNSGKGIETQGDGRAAANASESDQLRMFPIRIPHGYDHEEESQQTDKHLNSAQAGAHHVPGIRSTTASDSDEESAPHVSEDVHESPQAIVAEVVPDLVSATAVPEKEGGGDDDDKSLEAACFCCGFTCGSVGKVAQEGNQSRRRLYIVLGILTLIVIAVVVGASVGLASSGSQTGETGQLSEPSDPPTPSPSQLVTAGPTGNQETPSPTAPLQTERLETTLSYTHFFFGHMFDITAKKDIKVSGMEVHVRSTDPERIEVWTKEGEYQGHETSKFQWAKIGEATVTGKGTNVLTPLPRDLFDPVHVSAGTRQAFYVTAQTTRAICFQERMNGTVSLIDYGEPTEFSNADLEINVGTGVQYLFENHGPPNIFNGALEYTLDE